VSLQGRSGVVVQEQGCRDIGLGSPWRDAVSVDLVPGELQLRDS
jgi:hypothetical protein